MAVVEDGDKRPSQDQILDTSISSANKMSSNKDYTRDLINKFIAEAVEAEQRSRCRVPLPTARHVQPHVQPQPLHVQPQQPRLDAEKIDGESEESYELSLGLSSNGRFGYDPNARKIERAASMIPATAGGSGAGADAGNLTRTCSLPVVKPAETREEWLRRKELQSQRRLEARRRNKEKRRHSRAARERNSRSAERGAERGAGSEGGGENSNNNNPVEQGANADGLIRTTSLVRRVGGIVLNKEKDQVVPISPPTSGGSSGTSSEVQLGQGTIPMDTQNSNLNSGIVGSLNQPIILNLLVCPSLGMFAGPQNKTKAGNFLEGSSSIKIVGPQNHLVGPQNQTMAAKSPLDEMPSVITKRTGPNGRRIEGFLYKYGRGRRNVKIVCVCHGSFLTPAEFVRHAGGGDVLNPLQEIIVKSSR
ncbi:ninja-family protein Os07g0602900-like isoform X2 [Vicia villosa]|uniref:ninja-family protein Os07g0602900-like isoform X2 n=1 Tax=Vicia villosa TaxID=3911 RepID=UPI00273C6F76|nr:ninja-family protein Os07g0602900-like isoform X2 [Vicia villosa]